MARYISSWGWVVGVVVKAAEVMGVKISCVCMYVQYLVLNGEVDEVGVDEHAEGRAEGGVVLEEHAGGDGLAGGGGVFFLGGGFGG